MLDPVALASEPVSRSAPSDAFGFGCQWAAGVAGVDGVAGLDEQDGCFLFGAGAVLDTSGNDVELTLVKLDVSVAQRSDRLGPPC